MVVSENKLVLLRGDSTVGVEAELLVDYLRECSIIGSSQLGRLVLQETCIIRGRIGGYCNNQSYYYW